MSEKISSTHETHEQPPVSAEVAQTMGSDAVKLAIQKTVELRAQMLNPQEDSVNNLENTYSLETEHEPEAESPNEKEDVDDVYRGQEIDAEKLKRQKDQVVNFFKDITYLVDNNDPILGQLSQIARRMHNGEISPSDETEQAIDQFVNKWLRAGRGDLLKETSASPRSITIREDLQVVLSAIK